MDRRFCTGIASGFPVNFRSYSYYSRIQLYMQFLKKKKRPGYYSNPCQAEFWEGVRRRVRRRVVSSLSLFASHPPQIQPSMSQTKFTQIDDQDLSLVNYNGTWIPGGSSNEYNGTVSSSTQVGDSFTVSFTG